MCRCIIEDLIDGANCVFFRFGLLLCNSFECCKNGAIYIPSILQQCSNNLMAFFFILSNFRVGVIIWCIFYYGNILRTSPLMRTILLAKRWIVLKFVEGFLNVPLNWYVDMFLLLISRDRECRIRFLSQPIMILYNSWSAWMRCSECFPQHIWF